MSYADKLLLENFKEFEHFADAIVSITLSKMNIDPDLACEIMLAVWEEMQDRMSFDQTFTEGLKAKKIIRAKRREKFEKELQKI